MINARHAQRAPCLPCARGRGGCTAGGRDDARGSDATGDYPGGSGRCGGDASAGDAGGGLYVTAHRSARVVVRAGHPAYVLVAKYRCDLGELAAATSLAIRLPGARRSVTLGLGSAGSGMDYCKHYRDDHPGNQVAVSPVEPSLAAAR